MSEVKTRSTVDPPAFTATTSLCNSNQQDSGPDSGTLRWGVGKYVVGEGLDGAELGAEGELDEFKFLGDQAALEFAADSGHSDIVNHLLKHSSFPPELPGDRFLTARKASASRSRMDLGTCFGSLGRLEREHFQHCLEHGHRDAGMYILERGGEIDDAFQSACTGGHLELAKELWGMRGEGRLDLDGALRSACTFGRLELVRQLLCGDGRRDLEMGLVRAG
ncbi:uncharacterized protein EV422DRAFT_506574 [Fimicolochytrium jonesii]|uniref:uncharacterized protein n=1 Tax=Fimicolochytrium jonesii TaxID=1396493 RepID=UPI0022FE67DE|nr:uncharacterized protein EV422DRAFT_506574 [Fimicolochytrium jonesii]KAI8820853.1 hypothetical protein EV422DRAFT_506574 [Fimicolochytrium jonesii]